MDKSEEAIRLGELAEVLKRGVAESRILRYEPYWWQADFHAAGRNNQERMLMAANRVGKTMSAGAEVSFHLTGNYPKRGEYFFADTEVNQILNRVGKDVWPNGWEGKRFDHPVLGWTGSPTNETSKDIVQKELLGGLGEDLGTGWIPKSKIVGRPTTRQAGVKNVIDSFQVRHVTGGVSTCILKTYEQGWQKWQGGQPHFVWLDEEPDDYMIYSEAQTRVITSHGIILVTFTPLLGQTELVEHFEEGGPGIYKISVTWDDAPHLSKKDKDRLSQSYRAHERDARMRGIPMLGEGAVFPVSEDQIAFDLAAEFPTGIPDYFARIKGCDFGIDHPAAGIELAWNRDSDIIYVIDGYRKAGETAPYHAAWFTKGQNARLIPVAWPHDGMNREKSGGKTLAQSYGDHGVNMLSKSARYPKARGEKSDKGGPQPVEPIIDEMLERMMTGRLKVARHLRHWFEEARSYHRKDGRIVDRRDDMLKATMYAIMMKRYAVAPSMIGAHEASGFAGPIATSRVT